MKNKLILFLLPVLLIVFGYVIYVDEFGGSSEPMKASSSNKEIFVKPESREAYQSKIDMKKKKETEDHKKKLAMSKASKPSDFFSRAKSSSSKNTDDEPEEDVVEEEPEVEVKKEAPVTKVVYVQAPVEEPEVQDEPRQRRRAGFNSASTNSGTSDSNSSTGSNEVLAVVHRDSQVEMNQIVKLRTTNEVFINGIKVPANTYVDGVVSFGDNRVYLTVQGFTVNGQFVNSKMEAYSLNGGRGLAANTNENKEAGKQAVSTAISSATNKVKMPLGLGGTANQLGQDKVNSPSVLLRSGTKVYLR